MLCRSINKEVASVDEDQWEAEEGGNARSMDDTTIKTVEGAVLSPKQVSVC
jgi:hypothetical protein